MSSTSPRANVSSRSFIQICVGAMHYRQRAESVRMTRRTALATRPAAAAGITVPNMTGRGEAILRWELFDLREAEAMRADRQGVEPTWRMIFLWCCRAGKPLRPCSPRHARVPEPSAPMKGAYRSFACWMYSAVGWAGVYGSWAVPCM